MESKNNSIKMEFKTGTLLMQSRKKIETGLKNYRAASPRPYLQASECTNNLTLVTEKAKEYEGFTKSNGISGLLFRILIF